MKEPEEKQKALRFIHSESKRLDDISKKLLNLFRLGNGRVLRKKRDRVALLLEHLETISKLSLASKGQTLKMESTVADAAVDEELLLHALSSLHGHK